MTIVVFFSGMYFVSKVFLRSTVRPILREVDIAGVRRLHVQNAFDELHEGILTVNEDNAAIWLKKVS